MKKIYLISFFIFSFPFCNINITKSQTGCDFAAIRAAFAAPGHYTELTVSGQPCSMYFVNTTSQDADLSEQQAQTLGANMAVFNNAAENSAVTTAIYATYSGAIWVGYKRSGTGASTFYAMDGTTGNFTPGAATAGLYQNWAAGEPNNSGYAPGPFCFGGYACTNGEQCTQIYSAGTWNDLPCNTSSISVVEVNLCPATTINPSATTICGGGSVSLPASTILGSAPYTYSWTSSPAGFTSTSSGPTASPSVNTTYSVTATDRYGCTSTASVLIQVIPVVAVISGVTSAGCTTMCNGTATASASGGTGAGAYAYSWSTSPVQTTATATGLCAGTYTCTVTKGACVASGAELVTNGDFSAGNTGFSSTYTYWPSGTAGDMSEGRYYVGSNATTVHSQFTGAGRGGGNFMVVNGASSVTNVWCQTINVITNTDYVFSSWLSTVHTGNPASLLFSFNGVTAGNALIAPATTGSWINFFASWNSGVNTSVNICVVNQNTVTNGNDFGLDDISFKLCVPACEDTAIAIITAPSIAVAPITPSTICANGNAVLTAVPSGGNGTYNYVWSPAGTGTTASVTVSPVITSGYTVNVTDGNGCAAPPVEGIVTVNNVLSVTVNSAALCFAQSATLIASGASTYSWSPATALSSTTGESVVCTPTADVTYTVTGTSGGCVGTAVSTVTINPTPDSHAGPDITVCSGVTGNIGALPTAGYVYNWLPASGLSSTTVANPTVNTTNFTAGTISTTYTVTTSPAGCFSTDEVIVTVNPSFDPTFNFSSSTFCKSAGAADPAPTIVSAGGAFIFTPVGLSINGSSGLVDLSLSTLGTYTITYSFGGGCPSSSDQTITITNIPDANFSYGIYCQNDVPNPAPTFPFGSSAGVFSETTGGLKFISPITTPGEIDLAASTPGTYTVTNTIAAAGGCSPAVATNTIIINPVPVTTVDNKTICSGSATALTASGAVSYVWAADNSILDSLLVSPGTTTPYIVTGSSAGCFSTAIGTVTVNLIPTVTVNNPTVCAGIAATMTASGATSYSWSTGFNADPLIINPAVAASYTVTGTSLGCSSTALATVTVNPLPVIGVNSPVVCQGLAATLTATGAVSYLWNTGSAANPLVINPAVAANYTVTGTSAAGCTGTAVANVSITLLPVITVNAPVICLGQAATLTATGGATLTWSNGVTARSITVSPNATTSYTVADNTSGCSGSATGMVTVNQPPVIGANSATICLGQPASLLATGTVAYVWSTGSVTNPLSVSPPTTTTYTVIGTNAAGCKDTATTTINVNQPPVVTVNPDTICAGLNAILTASGAVSYLWSNNSTSDPLNIIALNNTTTYTVTGTDANGCSAPAAATVKVYPKPGANFDASPNPAGVFDPVVTFNNQSSADVNYWFWSFGDGDSLSNNTPSPTHAYPGDTASYYAKLIVHNAGFCYDSIKHLILIGPEYSFYIPNAFTPDGDGINDVFFGKGVGILEYELMIFDRWGNFIFTTDKIEKAWDGKANGGTDASQQDVYVWKVAITDIFTKKHNYTGTVTVIRGR